VRSVLVVLMAAAALVLPATAAAGGWATVELSSTPDGMNAGEPWVVDLEILQHGHTPLAGLQPSVTITERRSGAARVVDAHPAGPRGTYRARVVFPTAGTWSYVVDDGFTQRHSFPPVTIGGAAAAATGGGDDKPWAALALAAAVGLLVAGLAALAMRRRPAPAP